MSFIGLHVKCLIDLNKCLKIIIIISTHTHGFICVYTVYISSLVTLGNSGTSEGS